MHAARKPPISSWPRFDQLIRSRGGKLLARLDEFPNAILVAGCQRSGTTAVSRLITGSAGLAQFQFGKDDELDAALILSGWVDFKPKGRYCFQTTYLNDRYFEYTQHDNYRLLWILRNPHSVVFSMLNNWKRSALNRLFCHVGADLLTEQELPIYELFGASAISRIRKACLSYNAKLHQISFLKAAVPENRFKVIDYDHLVCRKNSVLPQIYAYCGVNYDPGYGQKLHNKSIGRSKELPKSAAEYVERICAPLYEKASLLTDK